jgi:hypothetical protein
VGLERGPLSLVRIIEELLEWKSSLVRIIEELLEWKSSGPGLENRY